MKSFSYRSLLKLILFSVCTTAYSHSLIDVVIPCHEKDLNKLELVLNGLKQFAHGIGRIIIVSNKKLTNSAEWFDEKKFPFNKETIAYEIFQNEQQAQHYAHKNGSRAGWLFQQLIKLYAGFIIPDLSDRYLAFDADTILLKPISFIDENGWVLFNISTIENHRPYFEHAEKLVNNFERKYPQYSGITHHMVFEKDILTHLFNNIFEKHNLEPWVAMCRLLDKRHLHPLGSAMSEYEIYFNFALTRYPERVKIRRLSWRNLRFSSFSRKSNWPFHYVACHSWL